jgi:hypothetical protein
VISALRGKRVVVVVVNGDVLVNALVQAHGMQMGRLFDSIPESDNTTTKLMPTSKCSQIFFLLLRRAADPKAILVIVIVDVNSFKKGFYYLEE